MIKSQKITMVHHLSRIDKTSIKYSAENNQNLEDGSELNFDELRITHTHRPNSGEIN